MVMADNTYWYDVTNKVQDETNTSSSSKKNNSDLGKDAFLRLLVTQLQYQDPLDPMDNTEFVSQMAQFTSLEQMNNLNNTMTNSQAYSMIGRTVFAQVYNETKNTYEDITGTVDSVVVKSSGAFLKVGDKEIPYEDVKQVYSTDVNTSIDRNLVVSQALSLVGKNIQAITFDDDLDPKEFIEGKVDYVKFIDDTPVLSVNGKDVYTHEVISVSDNTLLKGQNVSAEVYDKEAKKNVVVKGSVEDVVINGDSIYLVVDGKKAEIKDVSSVLKALEYVGQNIDYKYRDEDKGTTITIAGKAEAVMIRNKECYLVVGNEEVPVSKLR